MGFITKSLITKSVPVDMTGSRVSFTGAPQNPQNDETYLRYYKQISWLRAAVSVIAQGVAQSEWKLYTKKKDGDREEITGQHDLKDLLNRPNPFQSGHDFLYLHQVFDELLGRNFWVKQRNQGAKELWILPPQYTSPIADPTEYISGYTFKRGTYEKTFKTDEIIMFIDPDPLDPIMGAGRAQSVGIDIENQSYMSQWNRNFFYWGADPGTVITYPIDANITSGELDRLNEQWSAGHRSYGRAHKAAILTQGATVAKQGIGQRDMDFTGLAKYNRESILGVFGVSYSMVGGTDDVNRANAEAQLFNFARWVLTPRLIRLREKLNMFLCPEYGLDLELDFEDPAPENEELNINKATRSFQTGIATRNEARAMIDLDPDETEAGDEYYKAPAPSLNFGNVEGDKPENKPKETLDENLQKKPKKKAYFSNESDAGEYWQKYVKRTDSYEPKVIEALRGIFSKQRTEALESLKGAISREHKLIDTEKAVKAYTDAMSPLMLTVINDAVKNGLELVTPKNPHKAEPEVPLLANKRAQEWLKGRIAWAAFQFGEETGRELADVLSAGFTAGESTDKIAARIQEAFDSMSEVRAQRIARTEVLSASNIGNIEGYKEAGVQKTETFAALDERLCPLCASMHGQIHEINEGYMPPFHPNCRCIELPVIE